MKTLGGEEISSLGEGDELCGQESSFRTWASSTFKVLILYICLQQLNFEVNFYFIIFGLSYHV